MEITEQHDTDIEFIKVISITDTGLPGYYIYHTKLDKYLFKSVRFKNPQVAVDLVNGSLKFCDWDISDLADLSDSHIYAQYRFVRETVMETLIKSELVYND